ncbi:LysR family transcriptional regulator [Pseudomonas sp. dw_358]|uniref:LysR family transcriptional regulator n=1 Tax=Pseudomonas sp. dw_358 TaxID=2720083 RepID=UPI001BD2ED3C|nr:LysR family transcriptional regulator [Pseudomonas sp. dw_358]
MDYFVALTAFVEAAQSRSFSQAAEGLGIKASTVSRYVKELEQDLGIALFNRSTRMLHLTEGGETFLLHARRVLDELEQAKAATSALNQHPRGLLKLSLPPAFARRHVLPALPEFLQRFPEVRLELLLDEAQANLIQAGIDLAIRIGTLADSGLKARKITEQRQLLVVSPTFAAQHGEPASPDGLIRLPAVIGTALLAEPEWAGGQQIRINDLEARLLAVRQGLGVGLLPDWLVADSLAAGQLLKWLPDWQPVAPVAVWFVYPPKRIVSSKVRCFIDFMIERIGIQPDGQGLS